MSSPSASHTPTGAFEFDALNHATRYQAALVKEFSPHLRGNFLEVGSGLEQMTRWFSAQGLTHFLALEPDGSFCRRFHADLPRRWIVQGTVKAVAPESAWDTIWSVNVLEHIQDDRGELVAYAKLLAKNHGSLCLFVPARPEIYAPIDRDFGHYRRYTRKELRGKLQDAGFQIVRLNYFNFVGYFGWWLNFRVLRQRRFATSSVKLFDRFIFPWAHAVESCCVRPPWGQSLLAVARA